MAEPESVGLLLAYLRATGEKPSEFARRNGINESTLFHILSGRRKPGRDLSIVIELGTDGKVPASAWSQTKKRTRPKAA